jgi:ribosomal RNA-processing protein 12
LHNIYHIIFVFLQDALRCLAQLSGSTNICNLFLSLVKRFGLEDTQSEQENIECQTNEVDKKDEEGTDVDEEKNKKRSAIIPLCIYDVCFQCRLLIL